MFRDPLLNDNGAQKRMDVILAEKDNEATKWLSSQEYQALCVSIFPACLETNKRMVQGCGSTIHDYPTPHGQCCTPCCPEETHICVKPKTGATGCIVLERKLGGRPDCSAEPVAIWELDGSTDPWDYDNKTGGFVLPKKFCTCKGFYRLRVVEFGDPVKLSIQRIRASDAL